MEIKNISFNIFADTDEEAENGRKAIIKFISMMGQQGAMVSGNKIADAVSKLGCSPFIFSQIVKFFKQ